MLFKLAVGIFTMMCVCVCVCVYVWSRYMALRNVRANHIGQLVSIKAMVARCSDVKPLAKVAYVPTHSRGWELAKASEGMGSSNRK